MPKLDSITIEGFKSIRDFKFDVRPINALIGANGSGKSNLLEATSLLQSIRAGNLQDYIARAGGADRLLHFGAKTTPEVMLHISFDNEVTQYKITLAASDEDMLYPSAERVYFWNKKSHPDRPFEDAISSLRSGEAGISARVPNYNNPESSKSIGSHVQERLDGLLNYHFHDTGRLSPMKKTHDIHDNWRLYPDGSNLAAFLHRLRQTHEDAYEFIRWTIKQVAPFFEDFVLRPQTTNEDTIRLRWKQAGTVSDFDVALLSDGTLRFMALTTLFMQPEELRPSVILLDEPELGLHPAAIDLFASMVKSVAATGTQVVFATQSAILVDYFDPDDVIVADRADGATEFSRYDEDKLAVWLDDYSLGELWEMNHIGGRPDRELKTKVPIA